jgi:hypothetical protein
LYSSLHHPTHTNLIGIICVFVYYLYNIETEHVRSYLLTYSFCLSLIHYFKERFEESQSIPRWGCKYTVYVCFWSLWTRINFFFWAVFPTLFRNGSAKMHPSCGIVKQANNIYLPCCPLPKVFLYVSGSIQSILNNYNVETCFVVLRKTKPLMFRIGPY